MSEMNVLSDAVRYRLQQQLAGRVLRSEGGHSFGRQTEYAVYIHRRLITWLRTLSENVHHHSHTLILHSEPLGWCKA